MTKINSGRLFLHVFQIKIIITGDNGCKRHWIVVNCIRSSVDLYRLKSLISLIMRCVFCPFNGATAEHEKMFAFTKGAFFQSIKKDRLLQRPAKKK